MTPVAVATNFWDKIDYNSAPVKNNFALFPLKPLFSEPGYPMVSFKFLPCRPLLPWQRILGTKLTTTPPAWKIISPCLHLPPYFRTRAMQWCHVNFSPEDPCCHGNQLLLFNDKIGCRLRRALNAETHAM